MNQKNKNESLEALLKASLKVNPICNEKNFHRCLSSKRNISRRDTRVKTSQSVHKEQPTLVKYPLRSIPPGLEQPSKVEAPKPKKTSTLAFIEKLKQIDTKNDNGTFLEQANQEINVAYQQLQEIQKLIALTEISDSRLVDEEDEERKRRHRYSVVDKCNKQIEKMQKKYLNKTRIHYKSLQDFENMTLGQDGHSSVKGKEVEVLFPKNKSTASDHIVMPNQSKKQLKTSIKSKSEKEDDKISHPTHETVQQKDQLGTIRAAERDKIRSLLKTEEIVRSIKKDSNECLRENSKIRYLLKPESTAEANKKKIPVAATVQTDNDRRKSETNRVKQNNKRTNRAKFEDRRIQQSILKYDSSLSTSTEDLDDVADLQSENHSLIRNESVQAGNTHLKPRFLRKLQKIDESIMTSDILANNVDSNVEKYVEGREKLNLLLHGKRKLSGKSDDSGIADSVLKSAYLSKEFGVDVKNGLSKVGKDRADKRSSMQLVEAVVNKFRTQLQPNQLANLKGRDWKLHSKLTSLLENTLFTELKK